MGDGHGTWFAVHTNARKEDLVNRLLEHQGFATLYLHYQTTVKHGRRTYINFRPYFPRYVFASPAEHLSVYDINRTIGVSTVVYLGDQPLEIPTPVVDELRARGNSRGLVKLAAEEHGEHRKRYRQGQHVRIADGPLAGFLAVVAVDRGHQVRVWVEMFKGQVEAAFRPEALSPVRRSYP